MKCIPVKTELRAYDVLLGTDLLSEAGTLLRSELNVRDEKLFIISSANVWQHWGDALAQSLDRAQLPWRKLLIADGEEAKRLVTVEHAAEQLARLGADRSSIIVAFGGGVIGDMAGFLAATYMRGIPVVQMPTTLLAQVDASIGGKTGVNLTTGKNLIGSFHQPTIVMIDPLLTNTLSGREFRSGLFEVIKCGIIADPVLFAKTEQEHRAVLSRNEALLEFCIESSVRIKAGVVSKDERESGLRRILNYGHTIGHALEAETRYAHFLHGEAVAWGMIAAARIALQINVCCQQTAARIADTVLRYGPLPPITVEAESIVARIGSDKKTLGGKTHFVLASAIGNTIISSDVPTEVIVSAVKYMQHLSQDQQHD